MDVGWGFYLQSTGENQTRYHSRWLADYDPSFGNKVGHNL